jgi:acetyl esterase/lipase
LWSRSENPIEWAEKVSLSAKVVALTGSRDSNTSVDLAKAYVDALRARGIDATFLEIAGATHNSAFRSPEIIQTITKLLNSSPFIANSDASLHGKIASGTP